MPYPIRDARKHRGIDTYWSASAKKVFTDADLEFFEIDKMDLDQIPEFVKDAELVATRGDLVRMIFTPEERHSKIDFAKPAGTAEYTKPEYVWSYLRNETFGEPLHLYREAAIRGWTFTENAIRILKGAEILRHMIL